MESPQEFMERFLREQAQLNEKASRLHNEFQGKFYERDYLALLCKASAKADANREIILNVENSNDTAKVITQGGEYPKRIRYNLRQKTGTWGITGIEWDCALCDGTGTGRKYGPPTCPHCGGTGWRDVLKEPPDITSVLNANVKTNLFTKLKRWFKKT